MEFTKITLIIIAMNVSNTSCQKEFMRVPLLRSTYGKFVEISIESFMKVFLVLMFSLPLNFNEFKETVFSSNCLSSFSNS